MASHVDKKSKLSEVPNIIKRSAHGPLSYSKKLSPFLVFINSVVKIMSSMEFGFFGIELMVLTRPIIRLIAFIVGIDAAVAFFNSPTLAAIMLRVLSLVSFACRFIDFNALCRSFSRGSGACICWPLIYRFSPCMTLLFFLNLHRQLWLERRLNK